MREKIDTIQVIFKTQSEMLADARQSLSYAKRDNWKRSHQHYRIADCREMVPSPVQHQPTQSKSRTSRVCESFSPFPPALPVDRNKTTCTGRFVPKSSSPTPTCTHKLMAFRSTIGPIHPYIHSHGMSHSLP